MKLQASPCIHKKRKTIEFNIRLSAASHITLSGSFNHWAKDEFEMKPNKNGVWKIEIPMPPHGKYYYKFCIDEKMWMEDIENPLREPDGVTGWNSVLTV
ncbi:MAG TPA: hypothetical protein VKR53_08765 [Puia sp.]|nr:hypothetical protein [Puia sp.]